MARVLVLAPTPYFSDRGCHVRILEQNRIIERLGHQPLLITYPLGNDAGEARTLRAKNLTGYGKLDPGPHWGRLFLDLQVAIIALRECLREKPSLIHAYLHEGAAIGYLARAVFGVPLVFDYQGSLAGEMAQHRFIEDSGPLHKLFGVVEWIIDRLPDLTIASSSSLLANNTNAGEAAVTVADCVDVERFSPGAPPRDLLERHGKADVLYLGAMTDYQGVDTLLESARLLAERGRDLSFLLMGYPEEAYEARAREAGLEGRVKFTGRVDYFRAHEYLRLGEIAATAKLSRAEANGKVYNYMAAGLAVVAFDLGVNREILGDAAKWVEPKLDPADRAEAFAKAIEDLVDDPAERRRLGKLARDKAVAEHDIAARARSMEAAYFRAAKTYAGSWRHRATKNFRRLVHGPALVLSALDRRAIMLKRGGSSAFGRASESGHWSRPGGGEILNWLDHPYVNAMVNESVSGHPDRNWVDHFLSTRGAAEFSRALNLGCGFGDLEAHVLGRAPGFSFVSVDISEEACSAAAERLRGLDVVVRRADLNAAELEAGRYGVVFASSSLHHLRRLEHVLGQVERSLIDGGLFVFNEYVGPSNFQWGEAQLEVVNELLAALPRRYRRNHRSVIFTKDRVYPRPLDGTSLDSPEEAARSGEIMALVEARFDIVERRDYGGTVLHPLLEGIAGNFDPADEKDCEALRKFRELETALTGSGALASDFVYVVARKKGGGP